MQTVTYKIDKWISKVLQDSTGNCIQYTVISHSGKEYETSMYMYD